MPIALTNRSRSIISAVSLSSAALVTLHVAHAAPSSLPAPTPNVVEGTVKTVDGRPLPGATIRIAGATGAGRGTTIRTVTDARGNYRVTVPLGHYDVDGFADIEYEGQTYKEIWLDRGNATCARVMSDKGIVRHFTLRLSGLKRCANGVNANNPNDYNGAYITAMTSAFPDDAVITFNLDPIGPLADGTKGRPLSVSRSGAALKKGGGPIDETSFLHDIPLGRYRMTADVRYADGQKKGTTLELRDSGNTSGRTLEIRFAANIFGGGIRPVGVGVIPGTALQVADAPLTSEADAANTQRENPDTQPEPRETRATTTGPELPLGRYACSYHSQYAGDIPTEKSITIIAGGRYRAYGSDGTYSLNPTSMVVEWAGPLGDDGVRATFGKRNGRPAITVVGGGASDDPDRTNYCVLIES